MSNSNIQLISRYAPSKEAGQRLVEEVKAIIDTERHKANAKMAQKILKAYGSKLPEDLVKQLRAVL